MATRLYVGNLAYETTANDVRRMFEASGTVTACELSVDRFSGRSRGFAFVEMSTQEEADRAIEQCNGADLDGRKLVVNEARPRAERVFRDSSPRPQRGTKTFRPAKGSRRGIRRAKRDRKASC